MTHSFYMDTIHFIKKCFIQKIFDLDWSFRFFLETPYRVSQFCSTVTNFDFLNRTSYIFFRIWNSAKRRVVVYHIIKIRLRSPVRTGKLVSIGWIEVNFAPGDGQFSCLLVLFAKSEIQEVIKQCYQI